ncbi:Beta-galactosidase [Indibacter alkaliphilus LW1]|uniref:Beta-galactosidase n=1 Tax=Indibacter alkaliphilus (strain CCUG 57479 / KCTC 22604 / LW1) TaxID=1189612 RepID=S2DNU2_INDAL|nr:sugar-binding domain-containing protein [Indibacter alkaliphilus]EOZ91493.1 Beta-galactosidase [Indibacter alkaliphilus LW1]
MKALFKIFSVSLIALLGLSMAYAQEEYQQPVISSPWSADVNKDAPHPEYPRPQMEREGWVNLNGLWDYAILAKGSDMPQNFQGKITVPFPVESQLSGVGKNVGKDNELWYFRKIDINNNQRKGKVLLHFGAVDWEAEVFVNGQSVGSHRGGYDPFYFDISQALKRGKSQEIAVRVWDPSDDGPQPRGKQVKKPHAIWYTPVSGIWQTVWMETVPETFISNLKTTPDFDRNLIKIKPELNGNPTGTKVKVTVLAEGSKVAESTGDLGDELEIPIPNARYWSPESPFLYDLKVELVKGNSTLDQVKSYTALRKISMGYDSNGNQRMLLNNKFVFQYGPLDQGWWPDGLYTAPTEEALVFDIVKTKEMGFNMIRKHVKVEPARWYYHCDKMGMLVWQDMPNGDHGNAWEHRLGIVGKGTERDRTAESEEIFRTEWKSIIDANYNFPSIVVWVPFNEAWGQFKTKEITEWTKKYDPSRLVNSASGGNFIIDGAKITGDMIDLHSYPEAVMPDPGIYGKDNIIVLGEFGGLGLPIENHTWQEKDNWGYQSFKNKKELSDRYAELIETMEKLIPKGLSAAVYTQTTDVEIEINGLMTYDRKVVKFDEKLMNKLHDKLYKIKVNLK